MTYDDNDNDGRFPDDSWVEVRYPRTGQEEHGDRAAWPWLPGSIVEQCGPDEWQVCVEDRDVAVLRDGRPAPKGTASRNQCRRMPPGRRLWRWLRQAVRSAWSSCHQHLPPAVAAK